MTFYMLENNRIWNEYTESQIDDLVERTFVHYKSTGFPYFETSFEYRQNQLRTLMKYDISNVIEDTTIKQTMHGLGLLWSFHPESFKVKSNNKLSPYEAFDNDELFRKVIRKRIALGSNLTPNGIRKMLKMYTGVQGVSNFRPTAAAAIYRFFLPEGGKVWDMSAGWGGRLLGAYKAGNIKYIGTDPSTVAQINNRAIADYICYDDAILLTIGSEEYKPDPESLDFCFTSPPYFDCEQYSSEDTQSYIKYPTKDRWISGFLHDTLRNCYVGLKKDSYLALNIANVPSFKNLQSTAKAEAETVGFEYKYSMKLALSSTIGKSGFKYEPVLIFHKK